MTLSRRDLLSASAASTALLAATATGQAESPPTAMPPAKFQLGLVSYNMAANWDLPTTLKICKSAGIAAVECRTTHKHGVEPTLTAEQRKSVKKQFADSGVVFWGCGSICEFHSDNPSVVEKNIETCREFVGLVAELGGKGVKVRPNGLVKGLSVEKSLEQIGKALIECGKAGEAAGVEIWVEVHGKDTQNPVHMKTIMEMCGHKSVGITWNSNPTDVKAGSVKESFELLKPWLKSCHINEIYKDHTKTYPYRELFRLFRETGYDRYTLIEVSKTPPDAATGEDLLKYYKALWTELTQS